MTGGVRDAAASGKPARKDDAEISPPRKACRPRRGSRSHLLHRPGAQLRAPAQRHDAVAAAGHLSDHQGRLRPRLRPDRPDHAGVPAHRLAAAAGGRHVYRPAAAALLAGRRHGLHAGRPDRAGARRQLRAAADRRGADRHRLVDLPPRVDAHGAHGLGRPARLCAVAVPGRRTGGAVARAAAGSLHRRAARAGEHLLVLAGGAAGDGAAAAGGAVVQAPVAGPGEGTQCRRRGAACSRRRPTSPWRSSSSSC